MGPAPICAYCRHLRRGDRLACDAFPDAIPKEIIEGLLDHRQPAAGDRGIQWAQDPDKSDLPEERYADLFASKLPLDSPIGELP